MIPFAPGSFSSLYSRPTFRSIFPWSPLGKISENGRFRCPCQICNNSAIRTLMEPQFAAKCCHVSRNGPLYSVKFVFTSPNKSLLLFVALRGLFRDSAKMDFKSSQNCRRVKLAALGERCLESCTSRCC